MDDLGPRVQPFSTWVTIALLGVALTAHAEEGKSGDGGDGKPAAEPPGVAQQLLAVETGDPLELARVVDRVGDAAVMTALDDAQPAAVRLQAVRAARLLGEPELALGPLIDIMAGRDALLAPGAARSVRAIAHRLAGEELASREASPASLHAHVEALRALAERSHVRADLRAMALEAVALLEPLLPVAENQPTEQRQGER